MFLTLFCSFVHFKVDFVVFSSLKPALRAFLGAHRSSAHRSSAQLIRVHGLSCGLPGPGARVVDACPRIRSTPARPQLARRRRRNGDRAVHRGCRAIIHVRLSQAVNNREEASHQQDPLAIDPGSRFRTRLREVPELTAAGRGDAQLIRLHGLCSDLQEPTRRRRVGRGVRHRITTTAVDRPGE